MGRLSIGDTVRLHANPERQGIIQSVLEEDDACWVLVKWAEAGPTAHLEEDVELVSPAS